MDIPCIKCICFPVCKSTIPNQNDTTLIYHELIHHIEAVLRLKCSLINNYIYYHANCSLEGYNKLLDYFKGD